MHITEREERSVKAEPEFACLLVAQQLGWSLGRNRTNRLEPIAHAPLVL